MHPLISFRFGKFVNILVNGYMKFSNNKYVHLFYVVGLIMYTLMHVISRCENKAGIHACLQISSRRFLKPFSVIQIQEALPSHIF